jgi:hypothetical protein
MGGSYYNGILSGYINTIGGGNYSIIAGGYQNCINATLSVVGGGWQNYVTGNYATTMGGLQNQGACGYGSTIGGGKNNTTIGQWSSAVGGFANSVSVYGDRGVALGPAFTSVGGDYAVAYYIAKNGGSFGIDHPDPAKKMTTQLFHSFVESPTAGDNLYRYEIVTKDCKAVLELPDYHKHLNEFDQVFVTAKNHFGNAYGKVDTTQSCVEFTSDTDGEYFVLLMATRKDEFAKHHWGGVERWKTVTIGEN